MHNNFWLILNKCMKLKKKHTKFEQYKHFFAANFEFCVRNPLFCTESMFRLTRGFLGT